MNRDSESWIFLSLSSGASHDLKVCSFAAEQPVLLHDPENNHGV